MQLLYAVLSQEDTLVPPHELVYNSAGAPRRPSGHTAMR